MKLRWVLIVLLIFSVGNLIQAQDDEQINLTTLQDGVPFSNVFEGDVNAHLYVFQGSANDIITISMVQEEGGQLDPYVVLLGDSGQVYAANDDDGDVPLSSLIEDFELPKDGTYFVLATSFDGTRNPVLLLEDETEPEPLFYEIVVSGMTANTEDEPDYRAGKIERDGSANLVTITVDEPVFYLTLVGSEGDVVTISTSHDGNGEEVDTLLYLFDPDGNRIAVNDDNGTTFFSTIEAVELPADGRYIVFATAFDFYQSYEQSWEGFGAFNVSIE